MRLSPSHVLLSTLIVVAASACSQSSDGTHERRSDERVNVGSCLQSDCDGRAAFGDCFCDEACEFFGNCCVDKKVVCDGEPTPEIDELNGSCLFGEDLVEMALSRALFAGPEITVTGDSDLGPIELANVLEGMSTVNGFDAEEDGVFKTLEEAVDSTDDHEIYKRHILDPLHFRQFDMYLFSGGDNISGFIYYSSERRLAATVGDASIGDCVPLFNHYEGLPWFYSN